MLMLRHIVIEKDGIYSANTADLHILRYYANAIAHLLPGIAAAAGEIAVTPEKAALPAAANAVPAE